MKTNQLIRLCLGVSIAMTSVNFAQAQQASDAQNLNQTEAEFQKLMPVTCNVETFFGDFKLDHSFPAQGEADKIYDLMDHQRPSQLYLWGLPLVGMTRWHQGYYDAYEDYDYNVLLDIKSFDEAAVS